MKIPSLKDVVSAEEWDLRVNLAACYRLVALAGWSDLIFTHISAKIPTALTGGEHQFLINPYGLLFDEITASSLVKINANGDKLSESDFDVNLAGFVIHGAIHAAREDVACVLHTHTPAGGAVCAQKDGLLPISQQSTLVLRSLCYHDYEGIAVHEAERLRLQQDLGANQFMILRNHGLLVTGTTIADAYCAMHLFELACQIQVNAQAGGELMRIPRHLLDSVAEAIGTMKRIRTPHSVLAWPALLRRLDRLNPGYER
jgi:ribulose-5-phosphate 4-epimerase/fuculose-1-phosphate aldolase